LKSDSLKYTSVITQSNNFSRWSKPDGQQQ
jgi:hypothetical protein